MHGSIETSVKTSAAADKLQSDQNETEGCQGLPVDLILREQSI